MLFGLINLLAMFQDYINKILAEIFDIFIIIYLNDIFIYTKSKQEEYIETVQ